MAKRSRQQEESRKSEGTTRGEQKAEIPVDTSNAAFTNATSSVALNSLLCPLKNVFLTILFTFSIYFVLSKRILSVA